MQTYIIFVVNSPILNRLILIMRNRYKTLWTWYFVLNFVTAADLTFSAHINAICTKVDRTLGFIKRNSNGFSNLHCLTTLFCTLLLRSRIRISCLELETTRSNRKNVQRRALLAVAH